MKASSSRQGWAAVLCSGRRPLPEDAATKKCADDVVCCLLFGGCEQAARLIGSGYRMTIAAPPIEPSEQLLGAKSQPRAFVSALRRGVTADPIAINDINLAAVEARRRFRFHFTMWEADRTRGCGRRSPHRASITSAARPALRSTDKSHARCGSAASSIAVAVSLGSGAPNSLRLCRMRHGSPSARQAAVGPLSTGIRHRFSGIFECC